MELPKVTSSKVPPMGEKNTGVKKDTPNSP